MTESKVDILMHTTLRASSTADHWAASPGDMGTRRSCCADVSNRCACTPAPLPNGLVRHGALTNLLGRCYVCSVAVSPRSPEKP